MPVVLVLDLSLSMARKISFSDSDGWTRFKLALRSIRIILDTLRTESKYERVSLVTFSTTWEVVCTFTTNYDLILSKLSTLEELCSSSFDRMLSGVNSYVYMELGASTPCQVVILTDSDSGSDWTTNARFTFPFHFPSRLIIVSIAADDEPIDVLRKLVELSGENGKMYRPAVMSSLNAFDRIIADIVMENFREFIAVVKYGRLMSVARVYPIPLELQKKMISYSHLKTVSNVIDICGVLSAADVGSPGPLSKHAIIPISNSSIVDQNHNLPCFEELHNGIAQDETTTPSFLALIHRCLKNENMAALCKLNTDWYGILYANVNVNTKKSHLALIVLHPGNEPIPWLGDLRYVGFRINTTLTVEELFPLKLKEKKGYSQNAIQWVKANGLHSDVMKIIRQARKLPEKMGIFYKDLNRLRNAALTFGFVELLDGLADMFDRECTLLPANAHPDCALQLTHAASELRRSLSYDNPGSLIQPLLTNFLCKN